MRDAAFDEGQTIVRRPREDDVTVRVDVHEAGCYDSAGGVDDGVGCDLLVGIDRDDAPVLDRDVASTFRRTGAVDNATVADDEVCLQWGTPSPGSKCPSEPP